MSRMTSLLLGLRSRGGGPRWLGALVLVVVLLTLGWLGAQAAPLLRAAVLPAPTEREQVDDAARLQRFAEALAAHGSQVNGRSLFFVPPRPRPPRQDVVVDTTPREPPKPTRYGGPAITAMVNNQVWFNDGQRVRLGESGRGVKIVSMNAPWSARIEWQGVEFDVDLFQRDSVVTRPVLGQGSTLLAPQDAAPASSPAQPPSSEPPAQPSPAASPSGPASPAADPGAPPDDPAHDPDPDPEPDDPSDEPHNDPAAPPAPEPEAS
ncbi:MAG: hypothetical protein KF699_09780 [Phycisphaeraceae bacterium]|nr:hypothetical protein [Phycisphaeraceae bacterium]